MCGRYTIIVTFEMLKKHFGFLNNINFPASYNAAPSQKLPVIIGNNIHLVPWGFRPHWAKTRDMNPQINARSETAHEKPFFRDALKSHRCLVPANGFYEWEKIKGGKQPWYFTCDNQILAFAGLYNEEGFCMLTRPSNGKVADIHGRMPLVISPENYNDWLNGPASSVQTLIKQSPSPDFSAHAVSMRVNSAQNDDETLIERSQLF